MRKEEEEEEVEEQGKDEKEVENRILKNTSRTSNLPLNLENKHQRRPHAPAEAPCDDVRQQVPLWSAFATSSGKARRERWRPPQPSQMVVTRAEIKGMFANTTAAPAPRRQARLLCGRKKVREEHGEKRVGRGGGMRHVLHRQDGDHHHY